MRRISRRERGYRMVTREAVEMWQGYRDHWADMQTSHRAFCLPPSLVAAFERLGAALKAADLSMSDVALPAAEEEAGR